MLRLTGYYDACGHPDGEHALAVGGYVSSEPAWQRFEKEWVRTLSKAGINAPFHMADFMAGQGHFRDWRGRQKDQQELLLKLVMIIKKHVRYSFSTMILLEGWREANTLYALQECHCTPYGLCGFFTMDKTLRWLRRRDRKHLPQFVFEDGDKHKGDFIWVMDQCVRQNPQVLQALKPRFESKDLPPLQAADFVLWEHLQMAKSRLRNPQAPPAFRASLRELATIKNQWGVIDRDRLLKFCVTFDVPKRGEDVRGWSPYRAPSVLKARAAMLR